MIPSRPLGHPAASAGHASVADTDEPEAASGELTRATPLGDWRIRMIDTCDRVPQGRLHLGLTTRWLRACIETCPLQVGERPPTPALESELEQLCATICRKLRLHAPFRVAGQAAAISANLMTEMHRLLDEAIAAPLSRILVDRIYSEFNLREPDWQRVSAHPGMSTPLLARQLEDSRMPRQPLSVRFATSSAPGMPKPSRPQPRGLTDA